MAVSPAHSTLLLFEGQCCWIAICTVSMSLGTQRPLECCGGHDSKHYHTSLSSSVQILYDISLPYGRDAFHSSSHSPTKLRMNVCASSTEAGSLDGISFVS